MAHTTHAAHVHEAVSASAHLADDVSPIVVLGARLDADCEAPGVLDSRIETAAPLAHAQPHRSVVVTGGYTQPACPSEAQKMEQMLRDRGVANTIIRDDRAGNTIENARYVSELGLGHTAVLVTSQDHMPRAQANFSEYGITTTGVPAF